jgi:hypothetical protein
MSERQSSHAELARHLNIARLIGASALVLAGIAVVESVWHRIFRSRDER